MDILTMFSAGILCISCFIIGAKVGQKVQRGEEIHIPTLSSADPGRIYREHRAKKAARREADRMAAILDNIERYDGTSAGQSDVPNPRG